MSDHEALREKCEGLAREMDCVLEGVKPMPEGGRVVDYIESVLLAFAESLVSEEREACESIVVEMIDDHDRVEDDGYQRPCAKPNAFCECFGISSLRKIVAAIRDRAKGGR